METESMERIDKRGTTVYLFDFFLKAVVNCLYTQN